MVAVSRLFQDVADAVRIVRGKDQGGNAISFAILGGTHVIWIVSLIVIVISLKDNERKC